MTMNTTPRIAIVGGGPGGLTLTRILQTRNIPATVFEREPHPDARPQGGTLDLHPASWQLAVRLAGLSMMRFWLSPAMKIKEFGSSTKTDMCWYCCKRMGSTMNKAD